MATFFFFITEKHKKSFETSNYYVCSQPESLYVPLLRLHLFFITFSHFPILLCLTWFCLFPYFVCVCVCICFFLLLFVLCNFQLKLKNFARFYNSFVFLCLFLSLSSLLLFYFIFCCWHFDIICLISNTGCY